MHGSAQDTARVAAQIVTGVGFLGAGVLRRARGHVHGLRTAASIWRPANLIQAQRNYFGAHRYERMDAKGVFHTQWEKE